MVTSSCFQKNSVEQEVSAVFLPSAPARMHHLSIVECLEKGTHSKDKLTHG